MGLSIYGYIIKKEFINDYDFKNDELNIIYSDNKLFTIYDVNIIARRSEYYKKYLIENFGKDNYPFYMDILWVITDKLNAINVSNDIKEYFKNINDNDKERLFDYANWLLLSSKYCDEYESK